MSPYCSDVGDKLTACRCDGTSVSASFTTYCFFFVLACPHPSWNACSYKPASFLIQFGGAIALDPNIRRHRSAISLAQEVRVHIQPMRVKFDGRNWGGYLIYYPAQASTKSAGAPRWLLSLYVRPRFTQWFLCATFDCAEVVVFLRLSQHEGGVVDRIAIHFHVQPIALAHEMAGLRPDWRI